MSLFKIFICLLIPFSIFSQDSIIVEKIWEKSEFYNLKGDRELSINILLENIDNIQNN